MMYISSSRECLRKINITNVDIIKIINFLSLNLSKLKI